MKRWRYFLEGGMRETKRETREGVAGMKGCVRGNERGSAVKPFAFVRFFFFLRVCDARHRRAQRREIEGMEKKEEEEERNDNERGS